MTWMFNSPVAAQTTESETPPPQTTGSAADLEITPRVGAGYNSSAAGHDGFGRFEGFVPLFQNPGKDVLFLEGRLLLDNGAHLGGNILLGYRAFNPELNRSFGGYVGYDNRDTGNTTFHQLGLGLESLGEIWDFRLNGYLPVGDTRQVVASNTVDGGFQPTGNLMFQGNSLLLPGENIFQTTTIREAAMSGLDFEVGAKLADLAYGGEVRGYGGVYYYDASGSPSTVGGKLRVEVRPTDYLNLGLGVQHDDLFGTNILFTVGGTFPGTRPSGYRKQRDEPESVWARMGESVSRTASIVVDQQVESVSFTEQSNIVATNPDTGQPWVFVHVTEGGNSDGTFESPFGTVREGVGIAQSDGNYIVYVRSGPASGDTGPITVPAKVQLLSAGVLQQINTQEFGVVILPFSNSGQLTNFTGTITMEDQSVLSGFNLTSSDGPGIAARNLSFVTIRDSNVVSSSEAALLLENTTGNILLTNTTLTGDATPALVGTNINNITFTGGSLTSTNSVTNGITLNDVSGAVDISNIPIIITAPQVNGISAANVTGSLTFANGEITSSQAEAILLENSTGAIAISGFEITDAGGSGISGSNLANVTLENNQITQAQNQGIILEQVDGTVEIANNTITDTMGVLPATPTATNPPTGQGIALVEVSGTIDITGNQITGTTGFLGSVDPTNPDNNFLRSGQGIALFNTTAGEANLTIAGNQVENNLEGIGIFLEEGAIVNSLEISNNRISNNLDSGVTITQGLLTFFSSGGTDGGNSQLNNATINNNTIENNTGFGISLFSFGGSANLAIANNPSISRNDFDGIAISANENAQLTTAINNNTSITGNGSDGIDIFAESDAQISATIDNNTSISNNDSDGIDIMAEDNAQITATIGNNTSISNNDSDGIDIFAEDDAQITATIENNTDINQNDLDGIVIGAGDNARINTTINNNTSISQNTSDGIDIFTENDAQITATIENNTTINNNDSDGIDIMAEDNSQITTTINNNANISQNSQEGIDIFAEDEARITATIEDNTSISQNEEEGIELFAEDEAQITAQINNNTNISQNGFDGIFLVSEGNSQIDANVQLNVLTDNAGFGLFGVVAGGRLCVNLNDNNSNTDYRLLNVGGILQVVDLLDVDARNTGNVLFDLFTTDDVGACP